LAVHAVGLELHLVPDLDALEHRGVLRLEHHRHPFVHVELLALAQP
jgi:hypothetical protein